MLAYIMWARGEVGIFWAYPAALLFHFILERRAANLFNASVVAITTLLRLAELRRRRRAARRRHAGLTIVFANVFSYVNETRRQREAEQEQLLELERDRLALLVHATQAGFTDWDTKANVVIYSERFKEMLGYPADFDTSAWRSFFDLMHAEDHPRVREVFRGLMREKRKPGLQPPGEPLEYRLLRNGGGHVWVQRGEPGAGRRRRQHPALHHLVPGRRRSTTSRRTACAPSSAASTWWCAPRAPASSTGTAAATPPGTRRASARCSATRPTPTPRTGPTTSRCCCTRRTGRASPSASASTSAAAAPRARRSTTTRRSTACMRADGSYVWVQSMGVCVRDENGFVTRFIAAITDITERRAQDEALRNAVRLREEVERMSRHDLKTPLNSVIAMARLLREDRKLGREDDELLGSIERAGARILSMVNLSLDLVRMEQGSYEFRPRVLDLAEVARRVAADLESQAATKGVSVRAGPPGAHYAFGEEHLCYSLFANLIKNAIEASPDGGEVGVSFEAGDGARLAQIHNQGAVPATIRSRFFQKYVTAGKSGGVGLGAYSARLLARVQRGDITMRSSPAEGTTLTVRLELADAAGQGPAAATAAAGRRVLIVDDDEFNRLVLRRFLPSPAFEVEEAVNGRAALDAARRSWPDAVLLDLEMPVMDGWEFAARLRQLERENGRKRCTIVALSSNDEDAVVRRALAAGCDHYHVKPAPRDTLLRLLAP